MSEVTIQIFGEQATIEGNQWTSDDKKIQDILNVQMDPDGISPSDPFPEYHIALAMLEQDPDGKIIEIIDDRDDRDLIY